VFLQIVPSSHHIYPIDAFVVIKVGIYLMNNEWQKHIFL
jgi:hypothetical protein